MYFSNEFYGLVRMGYRSPVALLHFKTPTFFTCTFEEQACWNKNETGFIKEKKLQYGESEIIFFLSTVRQ
jgi:hypothetical protein